MFSHTQFTIVGSGIAGASIAYHLSELGVRDIVVLEQHEPVSGTTSHAPGLVGQLRSSVGLMQMLMHSVRLYRSLEFESVRGFSEDGSVRLATTSARARQLERQAAFARSVGLEARIISPGELCELAPMVESRDVVAALHIPSDGSATAPILARAMLRDAATRGVIIHANSRVHSLEVADGRVRAVVTESDRVETETLIVAAGIWSPLVGRMAGVELPLTPMMHQYAVSDELPDLIGRTIPNVRDPDHLVYSRQRDRQIVFGGYERTPAPWNGDAIPERPDPTVVDFDEERFAGLHSAMSQRIPAMAHVPLVRRVNGLESFTIDGEFLLGPAVNVANFWAACGFCAHGVSGAGGVGKVIAEWLIHGDPGIDIAAMKLNRFAGLRPTAEEIRRGAVRIYSTYYDLPSD